MHWQELPDWNPEIEAPTDADLRAEFGPEPGMNEPEGVSSGGAQGYVPDASEPNWKDVATYLAESLRQAEVEIMHFCAEDEGDEEDATERDRLRAHFAGTSIGLSERFGVWHTAGGWTTDRHPLGT